MISKENCMTVRELINKLQEMPQDLPVYDFSYEEVNGCHIDTEFYQPKTDEDIAVVMID